MTKVLQNCFEDQKNHCLNLESRYCPLAANWKIDRQPCHWRSDVPWGYPQWGSSTCTVCAQSQTVASRWQVCQPAASFPFSLIQTSHEEKEINKSGRSHVDQAAMFTRKQKFWKLGLREWLPWTLFLGSRSLEHHTYLCFQELGLQLWIWMLRECGRQFSELQPIISNILESSPWADKSFWAENKVVQLIIQLKW